MHWAGDGQGVKFPKGVLCIYPRTERPGTTTLVSLLKGLKHTSENQTMVHPLLRSMQRNDLYVSICLSLGFGLKPWCC